VDPGQSAIKDGGLGIRRVSSLALPAFVASAASTMSIQADILADCDKSESDFLQAYLSDWSVKFGDVPDALYPPNSRFRTALVCWTTRAFIKN